jgi:hypothetical protein
VSEVFCGFAGRANTGKSKYSNCEKDTDTKRAVGCRDATTDKHLIKKSVNLSFLTMKSQHIRRHMIGNEHCNQKTDKKELLASDMKRQIDT